MFEEILVLMAQGLVLILPLWIMHKRAGFNPAFSLLVFVPFVGPIISILFLAFVPWPIKEIKNMATEV